MLTFLVTFLLNLFLNLSIYSRSDTNSRTMHIVDAQLCTKLINAKKEYAYLCSSATGTVANEHR